MNILNIKIDKPATRFCIFFLFKCNFYFNYFVLSLFKLMPKKNVRQTSDSRHKKKITRMNCVMNDKSFDLINGELFFFLIFTRQRYTLFFYKNILRLNLNTAQKFSTSSKRNAKNLCLIKNEQKTCVLYAKRAEDGGW